MDENELRDIQKAAEDALNFMNGLQTDPDKIKLWLSQGISAPQILLDRDESTSADPEIFPQSDTVFVSAELKRQGAVS